VFVSFFPKPRLFFISVAAWTLFCVLFWFYAGRDLGATFGLPPLAAGEIPPLGLPVFWSGPFIWFYIYFAVMLAAFYLFWRFYAPHPWQNWSILVSAFILFSTYLDVEVYVALNQWRGVFFDLFQKAITTPNSVTTSELWGFQLIFFVLTVPSVLLFVITRFVVSHFIFRWRTAMNDFYMANWSRLRHIEGASQRVQEDAMRFSTTVEGLGVAFAESILTLIAFLPVLATLSASITELPLIGAVPYSLVFAALIWATLGTGIVALAGIKLPGLEFKNQRVEAAYRKELVYGEDDPERAQPPTIQQLFAAVRRNYFTLYLHYSYFNAIRSSWGQINGSFISILLIPTIAAGKITLGVWQQILTAFGQVSASFQYLVAAWPTIVELISIYKRLRAFEATLDDEPLPEIDRHYLERQAAGVAPDEQPAS
jgi:peptide/bleomycin uptake transporter